MTRRRASSRTAAASSRCSATALSSGPWRSPWTSPSTRPSSGRTSSTTPRSAWASACTSRQPTAAREASSPSWWPSTAAASASTPTRRRTSTRLAAGTGALVLSADYRLAPEHRLPAAIDDAAAVLLWLRGQAARSPASSSDAAGADPWLSELADPGRVFVAGESAGGVLAHHLNVRFSGAPGALHPVRLRGVVALMPFFTGAEPTPSELRCPDEAYLNRDMSARFARLCLPPGATADHPFLNPFGPGAPALVVVAGDDILRDRNVEFVRRMRGMGKPVEVVEFPGQGHAFFSLRAWSEPVGELVRVFKRFMDEACQLQP
ncbi:hypothetical protein PVAP13_6KG247700 [Panicum virgatum]|uniref:Alpha/beta hydrolase fold-3 domain-containing protein n=1 Tax=Panicum virgatum TaxID=38727 RepID=A0A8T0RFG4_PANVG|nr:hypothetical protein PVAP13_6KG247700 [Panicum virgatum]